MLSWHLASRQMMWEKCVNKVAEKRRRKSIKQQIKIS
jgi:hypothetical protein